MSTFPPDASITSSEPAYGRRADAERNHARVLAHGARLLAEDPTVGMDEIAHAAGLTRATLYRHFPSRQDLLVAIDELAFQETERAIVDSRPEEDGAGEALGRLVAALLEVGDRYRFLQSDEAVALPEEERRAREERLAAPLRALVERGRRSGELSRRLPARWMLVTFGAVLCAAVREIAAGELDRARAGEIVTATLLHGYRAA